MQTLLVIAHKLAEISAALILLKAQAAVIPPSYTHDTISEHNPSYAVRELIKCESSERDVKVLDVNGKYSYGILQYQLDTFRAFGERYGILRKDLTDDEIRNIIMDHGLQIRIANRMVSDGLIYHWRNCAERNGLLAKR